MNSEGFSQEMQQTQSLTIAPQLRQSLKILQVPALELRNSILEELQTNPVLEELPVADISLEATASLSNDSNPSESDDSPDHNDELDFKEEYDVLQQLDEDWRDHFSAHETAHPFTQDDAAKRQYFLDSIVTEKSLQEYLMEQAKLSECTPEELQAMQYLVGSLDDRGFLTTELDEIAELANVPQKIVESAHNLLKTFDPPGIGSRNVQECLLQELTVAGMADSIAATIVKDHFQLLLRRRIPDIARKLSTSIEEVQAALESISSLDPSPGRNFKDDSNRTITPDVIVHKEDGRWIVSLNSEYIPRLRLSRSYKELMAKGSLSTKEREYIRDKMRSAKFLISSIEQRQKTLERITRAILQFQCNFFEEGVSKLHPLTMNQVGDALKLHETTISRAIANKYIQTPYGLFDFKYFFTFGFKSEDGDAISNTTIKEAIVKIVECEPPLKPYSDQRIVGLLAEKNIKIARRTVTKYREELGILATSLRRKYF